LVVDGGFIEIATLRLRLSICAGIEVSARIDNDDQQRGRCSNGNHGAFVDVFQNSLPALKIYRKSIVFMLRAL